jgi:hypothetical protein
MSQGNGMRFDGRLLIPANRLFSRSQGCWNCKGRGSAKEYWNGKRQEKLTKAIALAHESLLGEKDCRVVEIRRGIDYVDNQVAAGRLVVCRNNGRTGDGSPVGEFVDQSYLCDRWIAAEGASIARGASASDKLPEELEEIVDGARPKKRQNKVV